MTELESEIQEEMQRIVEVVMQITRLPSRWSGRIELVPDADFKGKKRWICDIQLQAALALKDERWSTMIHEALHSLSAGYNSSDYQVFKGWEEGTVEQLQRLLRGDVLSELGVTVALDTFEANDKFHAFNRYIDGLEQLRRALNSDESEQREFYIALLSVPIRDRSGYVLDRSRQKEGVFRLEFIKVFSAANALMMGGAR